MTESCSKLYTKNIYVPKISYEYAIFQVVWDKVHELLYYLEYQLLMAKFPLT